MLSFLAELKGPIVNGLLLGGLYGIIGIGMSMIFGIVRLVNLAHGDLVILASYLSLVTMAFFHVSPLITLVLVIPVMCLHWIRHPVLPSQPGFREGDESSPSGRFWSLHHFTKSPIIDLYAGCSGTTHLHLRPNHSSRRVLEPPGGLSSGFHRFNHYDRSVESVF